MVTSKVMFVGSALSLIYCIITILLYTCHPSLKSNINVNKKPWNKVILYITICDLFSSIGLLFGFAKDGSTECWISGLATNIFPVCSVLWTTVLIGIIHRLLNRRNVHDEIEIPRYVNVLVWTIPIIVTLLPLTTSTYGCNDEEYCWCFIKDLPSSPSWSLVFWYITAFYFWIWSTIVIYTIFCIYITYKINSYRKINYIIK
jgi:hypothetical protein